uniref:caspase family protein n=1 Tax=Marinobacterium profundum TaxID=1714300 RepID=UPI000A5E6C4F|nr:caspase family protein [Marinobacterium profundum]
MPPPFSQLNQDEFSELLAQFSFTRRINMVHVHHTWRPNHAQYRGHASIEGMWRHHTQTNGWRDIAQHVSIGPEGAIWLGRNFNLSPASAAGHNGSLDSGPFMIEVIGDFDLGQDQLMGSQRSALIHVIAAVQGHFNLPSTAIMFHNMMSTKSCPGTSVVFDELVGEVQAKQASALRNRQMTEQQRRIAEALTQLNREVPAPRGDESLAEHDPQGEFERGGFGSSSGLSSDIIDSLRPHVINLRGGQFSNDGSMTTTPQEVDTLIDQHLEAALAQAQAQQQPLRIMLYAHGGLVDENAGLMQAYKRLAWWKKNHIYPISFVWESGLFETITDRLKKALGQGERAIDFFAPTDFIIEKSARALKVDNIWRGMKSAAEAASADDGGAFYTAKKLQGFCARHANNVELHAVGHSAGSIFHAYLLTACQRLGLPAFRSLQLLAPAANIDLFKSHIVPLLGHKHGVDKLTLFTMTRHYEKADHCAHIYRKSLLYLVSAALETRVNTPISGLDESLRADAETVDLFGLGGRPGRADIHWAVSSTTASTSHGGFDDDTATLASVVRNIRGLSQTDPVVDYPLKDDGNAKRGATAGNRYALCIGINQYSRKPLAGCVADAQAWGTWLGSHGFEVSFLLDQEARAAAIVDGIDKLLSKATAEDVVVIQFAGHGTQIADNSGDEADQLDEAWVPVDFESGNFIIDDMLGDLFDRHRDRGVELVLFTDCCHSGTSTRAAFDAQAPENQSNSRFLDVEPELQRQFNQKHAARTLATTRNDAVGWEIHYAACQDHQSAYEENGQGNFTRASLNILQAITDNQMTYGMLADNIIKSFSNNHLQTPNFRARSHRRGQKLFSALSQQGATPSSQSTHVNISHAHTPPEYTDSLERIERRLDEISSLLRNRPSNG